MNNADSVLEQLGNISIGTIVSWFVAIGVIIGVLITGGIKLYKLFIKVNDVKQKDEEMKELLQSHTEQIKIITEKFDSFADRVTNMFEEQKENDERKKALDFKRLRYDLTTACNKALADNHIKLSTYKSLKEVYSDEYVGYYHGNSYVESLMNKVDDLEVDVDVIMPD